MAGIQSAPELALEHMVRNLSWYFVIGYGRYLLRRGVRAGS